MITKKKSPKIKKTGEKNDRILLLPVLFLTTLFLFCVRAQVVPSNVSEYFWYESGEIVVDLYANFRMKLFVLVTVVFGIYMLFSMVTDKVNFYKHKVYIPMLVYVVFVLLSYMFSAEKDVALWGYIGRYEGTIPLICYMGILFYGMHAVRNDGDVKRVLKCFAVACAILGIWGILQIKGVRLDDLPAALYIPASIRGNAEVAAKQATGAVNWFFSNQNYSSFFMVFPICLFAMGCIGAEDNKKKVLFAVLTGLMLFNLWQSASLGGMVGIAVSVVVALLLAGFQNIMKWKKSLGLLILAAVVSIGASMPVIMREVQSGVAANTLFGVKQVYADETAEEALRFVKIDHVVTDGDQIVFGFAGHDIIIKTKDGEIVSITDDTGAAYTPDRGLLSASTYVHEESGYPIFEVKTAQRTWNFTSVENTVYFLTPKGDGILLDKVESKGFEGNEDFATYRGYIWSRTFPLLKETVLFGKGADTYAVYFPHGDYAGKYNIGYFSDAQDILVDKPHSIYLGAAVNTGVISMLALIAIYVIYLIECVKVYRKHEFNKFSDYIGMGIAIAIAGFMVAGLVNDSSAQFMPVVYALTGVGFAINRMVKKTEEAE